jgi:hypothetical protein
MLVEGDDWHVCRRHAFCILCLLGHGDNLFKQLLEKVPCKHIVEQDMELHIFGKNGNHMYGHMFIFILELMIFKYVELFSHVLKTEVGTLHRFA